MFYDITFSGHRERRKKHTRKDNKGINRHTTLISMIAMIAEHTALCAPIEIQLSERVDTVMSFHAPPPEAKIQNNRNERKKEK